MDKAVITNFNKQTLQETFVSLGLKSYAGPQVFQWLYQSKVSSFEEMTNLSAALREKLKKDFSFDAAKVVREDVSEDTTRKALFELNDNEKIETVLIPTDTRATVCVSTQAGCKFGCRFCASGIGGWNRNLRSSEILGQILYMKKKRGTGLSRIWSLWGSANP